MTDETQGQPAAAEPAAAPDMAQVTADIMSFDPFGPATPAEPVQSDEPGKPAGEGSEGGAEIVEPTQPAPVETQPDPKTAAAPAPPPMQQGPTPREQELLAQVAALTQAIQKVQPPVQEQRTAEKPTNKYNLGLPPQLIQGLRSENDEEFAVAMHAVVNGIANKVWTDMQDHLSREFTPQIDRRVGAVLNNNTQVQRVHEEFYGEYPHLNNPVLMPLVQQAALAVAEQWHAQGKAIQWNKDFASQIATYIHQFVPAPQQQTQQQQPKRQQFTARPGARPAPAKDNDFASVL